MIENVAGTITQAQKKKIWAKAREIGIDKEDLYRLVEEISGAQSIRQLSKVQGIALIERLEGKKASRRWSPKCWPVSRGNKKIISLATRPQQNLINDLLIKSGWDEDHLNNFINLKFKRDNRKKLRRSEAGVVISILTREFKKIKGVA